MGLKAGPKAKVGEDGRAWTRQARVGKPVAAVGRGRRDGAAEALPELDRLVERMLVARGYAIDDPVVREGDDRDIVAEFLAAREITRLVERGAEDVSPGDVAAAVNGYRSLHDYLIVERAPP